MAVTGLQNVSVFGSSAYGDSQPGRSSNRASALLQIWREIEAENLAKHRNGSNSNSECLSSSMSIVQGSEIGDDTSQDSEDIVNQRFIGLEMDYEEDNGSVISDQSSDLGDIERERVRQIFKEWMSGGCKGGFNRRLCGRQTVIDLLVRIQSERKSELLGLSERRSVSNCAHRHRIQAFLKGRFLRNERSVTDERPSSSAATELGLLRQRHTVSDIREEFLSKLDNSTSTSSNADSASTYTVENKEALEFKCRKRRDARVQVASDVELAADVDRSLQDLEAQITEVEEPVTNNDQYEQEVLPGVGSANSREEPAVNTGGRQQEISVETEYARFGQASDTLVSNERLSESEEISSSRTIENYDETVQQKMGEGNTNKGFDSHNSSVRVDESQESVNEIVDVSRSWQESFANHCSPAASHNNINAQCLNQESHEDWQSYNSQEAINSWLDIPSGGLGESFGRRDTFHFHHDDAGDVRRTELRELFSRRRVSNLLHSGFRERLDRVLQSHSERLGNASDDWEHESTSQDFIEQGQAPFHGNLAASQPFWVEEFPAVTWPHQISHQHQPGTEWKVINELRIDIAQLHQRMNAMQSVLDECMDMQIELQRLVRQEVSAALNRAIFSKNSSSTHQAPDNHIHNKSDPWDHVRKGICCLCWNSKIDSLLYRCGHMCTCSKCVQTLIQHEGQCPMCRAPVVEAVRAYFVQ